MPYPKEENRLAITIYLWQTLRLRQIQYIVWEVPKIMVETDWLDLETSKSTLEILAFKGTVGTVRPFEEKRR